MKKKFVLTIVAIMATIGCYATRMGVYCYHDAIENHIYEDENVKIVIAASDAAHMKLAIYNKTDQVIYVDKENSFAYINDRPTNLFQNRSYTTGTGSESGASVNLGGIADALGIGGPVGSILGGVNVGGGTSNMNSTTTYEKRILSVAPQSLAELYDYTDCESFLEYGSGYIDSDPGNLGIFWGVRGCFVDPITKQKTKFQKGMVREYNEKNSPMRYKGVVKYATTEDFSNSVLATTENHICAIVIDSYKGVKKYETTALPYCTPYRHLQCCRFKAGTTKAGPLPCMIGFFSLLGGIFLIAMP